MNECGEKDCIPITLAKKNIQDQLICKICYQIMSKPVILSCNQKAEHIFGLGCIRRWWRNQLFKECPYCKTNVQSYTLHIKTNQLLKNILIKCQHCDWQGKFSSFSNHLSQCQVLFKVSKEKLDSLIKQQTALLQKQINPHLRQYHLEIFNKYVQNWNWLYWDQRDWKWWWWASNPWWGKPCLQCNNLWHKYEAEINNCEYQRIKLLKVIKNHGILDSIKNIFQQQ